MSHKEAETAPSFLEFKADHMVTGITWSEDGRFVVSSGHDGRLVWWDASIKAEHAGYSSGSMTAMLTGDNDSASSATEGGKRHQQTLTIIRNDRKNVKNQTEEDDDDDDIPKKKTRVGKTAECTEEQKSAKWHVDRDYTSLVKEWNSNGKKYKELVDYWNSACTLMEEFQDMLYGDIPWPPDPEELQEKVDYMKSLRDFMVDYIVEAEENGNRPLLTGISEQETSQKLQISDDVRKITSEFNRVWSYLMEEYPEAAESLFEQYEKFKMIEKEFNDIADGKKKWPGEVPRLRRLLDRMYEIFRIVHYAFNDEFDKEKELETAECTEEQKSAKWHVDRDYTSLVKEWNSNGKKYKELVDYWNSACTLMEEFQDMLYGDIPWPPDPEELQEKVDYMKSLRDFMVDYIVEAEENGNRPLLTGISEQETSQKLQISDDVRKITSEFNRLWSYYIEDYPDTAESLFDKYEKFKMIEKEFNDIANGRKKWPGEVPRLHRLRDRMYEILLIVHNAFNDEFDKEKELETEMSCAGCSKQIRLSATVGCMGCLKPILYTGTLASEKDAADELENVKQKVLEICDRIWEVTKDSKYKQELFRKQTRIERAACIACKSLREANQHLKAVDEIDARLFEFDNGCARGTSKDIVEETRQRKKENIQRDAKEAVFLLRIHANKSNSYDLIAEYVRQAEKIWKGMQNMESVGDMLHQLEGLRTIHAKWEAEQVYKMILSALKDGIKSSMRPFGEDADKTLQSCRECSSEQDVQKYQKKLQNVFERVYLYNYGCVYGTADGAESRKEKSSSLNREAAYVLSNIKKRAGKNAELNAKYVTSASNVTETMKKLYSVGDMQQKFDKLKAIEESMPVSTIDKRSSLLLKRVLEKRIVEDEDESIQWYELKILCEGNLYLEERWTEEGGKPGKINESPNNIQSLRSAFGFGSTDCVFTGSGRRKPGAHMTLRQFNHSSETRQVQNMYSDVPKKRQELELLLRNYGKDTDSDLPVPRIATDDEIKQLKEVIAFDEATVKFIKESITTLTKLQKSSSDHPNLENGYRLAVVVFNNALVQSYELEKKREYRKELRNALNISSDYNISKDLIRRKINNDKELGLSDRYEKKIDKMINDFNHILQSDRPPQVDPAYISSLKMEYTKLEKLSNAIDEEIIQNNIKKKNERDALQGDAASALEWMNVIHSRTHSAAKERGLDCKELDKMVKLSKKLLDEMENEIDIAKLVEMRDKVEFFRLQIYNWAAQNGIRTEVEKKVKAVVGKSSSLYDDAASSGERSNNVSADGKDETRKMPNDNYTTTWEITFLSAESMFHSVSLKKLSANHPSLGGKAANYMGKVMTGGGIAEEQGDMHLFDAANEKCSHLMEYVFRFCTRTKDGIYSAYTTTRGHSLMYRHLLIRSPESIQLMEINHLGGDSDDDFVKGYRNKLLGGRGIGDLHLLEYEMNEVPTAGRGEIYHHHGWNNVFKGDNPSLRTWYVIFHVYVMCMTYLQIRLIISVTVLL